MIYIYNKQEISKIKDACRLAASSLSFVAQHIQDGITTEEIDNICFKYVSSHGGKPATLGYKGYKHSCCVSVNDVVCHGIPSSQKIQNGDIVNIDIAVILDGFYGDNSMMVCVGDVSTLGKKIVNVCYEAMMAGIIECSPNKRLGDIGAAIQEHAEKHGFSVVEDYTGHGVGKEFHMEPKILHYGKRNVGKRLSPGMIFTIEPMINEGTKDIVEMDDGWTVKTKDGKLSAQWEHTILITENGYEILTL